MKVAILDPSSYTLAYDKFYTLEIKKELDVVFYLSSLEGVSEDFVKSLNKKGIETKVFKVSAKNYTRFKGVKDYLMMLFMVTKKYHQYDYIHFQWSIFFLLELPFLLFFRRKLVFTIHNDVPHGYKGKIYFPYWLISKIAKKIVFVSQYTKSQFEKNYGFSQKYILVQHGLMRVQNDSKTELNFAKADCSGVVFWGRVERYKGIDIFLKNFEDVNVSIVGRWAKELTILKEQLLEKPKIFIQDEYISESEIYSLISNTKSIFILPYNSATQSGVLYTFLAHSCVFISSNVGENYQFLKKHGLEQLSFDREDSHSILSAYKYALLNFDQLKIRIREISEEYEWDRILSTKKIATIYET